MTTKDDIISLVEKELQRHKDRRPIFKLKLLEFYDKEVIYKDGKRSGLPEIKTEDDVGFYYNIDDAIEAMNNNYDDIRDECFTCGFILCVFPGLYEYAGQSKRMFFQWDDEKQGFFQAEEPALLQKITFC